MSTGVMLTRAQPFHLGHLSTLRQILDENDKALVIVGSANKEDMKRNPFPIKMRMKQVKKAINYYMHLEKDRIKVIALNDWSMENYRPARKEWGNYLYYSIVNAIEEKTFTFYYNDDISVVEDEWFTEVLKARIQFKSLDRKKVAEGISSTKLREEILTKKYKEVLPHLLKSVTKKDFKKMKEILQNVETDEKEDFMMQ